MRWLPFVVRGELLVTVNRKVGSLDSMVKDGDTLKIAHQSRASHDGTTTSPPDSSRLSEGSDGA